MSDRRPIEADIQGTGDPGRREPDRPGTDSADGSSVEAGQEEGGSPVSEEVFKEALSYHAAGVTVVAIRDEGKVHATTVSAFIPVSPAPPTVLVSVGGNAQVLPFFEQESRFVVNLLGAEQRKLASVFADSFPVGPSPFPETGDPEIPESLVSLQCRAASLIETEGGLLVLGRVERARVREGDAALVHYRRGYHSVGGGGE